MRRAILKMTDSFLLEFLKSTFTKDIIHLEIKNGLPPDVKVIRAGHDNCGVLNLVLESVEFDNILNGGEYPVIDPIILQQVPENVS